MNTDFFNSVYEDVKILKKYIYYQSKFISEEVNRVDEIEKHEVEQEIKKQIDEAEIKNQSYQIDADKQKQIQILEEKLKAKTYNRDWDYSLILTQINALQNGYCEFAIMEQVRNTYAEFSESNFLGGTFRFAQNNATLVLIFSFWENCLKRFCRIHNYNKKRPRVEDCKKYLEKLNVINNKIFEDDEWKFMDKIRLLRNSVAHNSNIIDQSKSDELKNIEGTRLLENKGTYILIIDSDVFFEKILEKVLCFFEKLRFSTDKTQPEKR